MAVEMVDLMVVMSDDEMVAKWVDDWDSLWVAVLVHDLVEMLDAKMAA